MMVDEKIIGTTTIKFFDDYIDKNTEYVLKNLEIQVQNFLSTYIENN